MRAAVADYVSAVHTAYARQARLLPPAAAGRLPLVRATPFWVAAVGVRHLHLVATREPLEALHSKEVSVEGESAPLRWTVRFYDPVVIPGLGLVAEADGPAIDEVRGLIGVRTALYHLTLRPPAELAQHHGIHAGTALAHGHAAASHDFEAIRHAAPGREGLVDELEGAAIAGLVRAQGLLARAIAPGDTDVEVIASRLRPDPDELRRAVLKAVRRPC